MYKKKKYNKIEGDEAAWWHSKEYSKWILVTTSTRTKKLYTNVSTCTQQAWHSSIIKLLSSMFQHNFLISYLPFSGWLKMSHDSSIFDSMLYIHQCRVIPERGPEVVGIPLVYQCQTPSDPAYVRRTILTYPIHYSSGKSVVLVNFVLWWWTVNRTRSMSWYSTTCGTRIDYTDIDLWS